MDPLQIRLLGLDVLQGLAERHTAGIGVQTLQVSEEFIRIGERDALGNRQTLFCGIGVRSGGPTEKRKTRGYG